MKPILTILLSLIALTAKADDTATLQARINSAKIVITFSPDTVYNISSPLNIPSGLRVNNLHVIVTTPQPAIQLNSNSYLSGVAITGTYNNKLPTTAGIGSSGILVNGSNNVIDKVTIANVSAYGIVNSGNMNTISNCIITNTGYISIFSLGQNATIYRNKINRSGIPLANIREKCISVRGGAGTIVTSNSCIMPYKTQWSEECIEFMNAPNGVATYNFCRGGSIGISIVGSDYTRVTDNTCDRQTLEGLEIANCKYVNMCNNTLSNQSTGILVDANATSQFNALNYNTIAASLVGIDIGVNCPGNLVNGGVIVCNKGISIGGVTGTTISNVQMTGSTQAVVLDQSRGDVSGTSVINCVFIGFRSPVYLYATKPIVTKSVVITGTTINGQPVSLIKDLSNGATIIN